MFWAYREDTAPLKHPKPPLPADRTGHWLQVDLTAGTAGTSACAVE